MFGREFVLQCWRKSFRKKKCNGCCFFGCVCLLALLYSTFFVNEILSFIANQKKRRFQLVARFSQCCIRHIYRETNICANKLSRLGLVQSLDFVLYPSPPVDLLPLIEADKHGLYSNRRCPTPYYVFQFFIGIPVYQKKKNIYIYIYIPINSKAMFGKCD